MSQVQTGQFSGTTNLEHNNGHQALDGLYILHDEIGAGGFGKVRMATHLLTGQKVAIKIINKQKIEPDELPRVTHELHALKTLAHQNICRLYQVIETAQNYYIIMEYCSGGEMFDYIVDKERLSESEARHFFRQLVQAVAYAHSKGFAHRDLKPENLLLTDDLQLKLIDFGLCAHPELGLNDFLKTCCGSPSYAAPELGGPYKGTQADVWSMGVFLYALLCGHLPFEDERTDLLYAKIIDGRYYEPHYLSYHSKTFLRQLLEVDPRKRITVPELIIHSWVNMKYTQNLKWNSIYDRHVVDESIVVEIASHFGRPNMEIMHLIRRWKYDYLTATYLLLELRKKHGLSYSLPAYAPPVESRNPQQAILSSPTIHGSLSNDLNHSGFDKSDLIDFGDGQCESNVSPIFVSDKDDKIEATKPSKATTIDPNRTPKRESKRNAHIKQDKNISYAFAMLNMPSFYAGSPRRQRVACGLDAASDRDISVFATPLRPRTKPCCPTDIDTRYYCRTMDGKENHRPATVRGGPIKIQDERPRSGMYDTPVINVTPVKISSTKKRSNSIGRDSPSSETRNGRSSSRTPRLRQRVFASLERKAEKVINMLTPRRQYNSEPEVLRRAEGMTNISITSSRDPQLILCELVRVFAEQNISITQRGWKISGRKVDKLNRSLTVELQIVWIEMTDSERLVGVKRKRLCGDSFLYKTVCEQVLSMAGI